jgi:arylsulfate sulfotransferase
VKQIFKSKPVLFCAVLAVCTFMSACGGSSFNDPPGIASTSVASTANPLVAQVNVTAALGCSGQIMIEFGPDTTYGRNTAWASAPAYLSTTSFLVAGMRASTTYHMRAVAGCGGSATLSGQDMTFTTGPLPALPFPTLTVTRPSPSTTSPENPGIEMMTVLDPGTPAFFTDRDGNPIWYYDVGQGNYAFPFKLLPNGHIIMNITQTPVSLFLREVDLAGNTIQEMSIGQLQQKMQEAGYDFVPVAMHHDLLPLANGHVILLVNFTENFGNLTGYPGTTAVLGDGLIDLDQNWNPVWAWNSFDHVSPNGPLDLNRHLNGLPDWTHSNGLAYSPDDGNLLLSMRHQSWVLKIDYNNGAGAGDILWRLGYQGDFSLTAGGIPNDGDPSQWFSFQHFPNLLSQTGSQDTLMVWDNGDSRVLDTSGTICGVAPSYTPCYSRATIFQIDESAKVADLEWFDLPGAFSLWGGSIGQLTNGNVEFDINAPTPPLTPGLASQVEEVTQTATPQVVWQMAISPAAANAYRAYRFPSLYNGVVWQY